MDFFFVKTVAKSGNYKIFTRLETTNRPVSNTQRRTSQIFSPMDPKYLNWPFRSVKKLNWNSTGRARGKRKKMESLATGIGN
jgi:hypothetical protein